MKTLPALLSLCEGGGGGGGQRWPADSPQNKKYITTSSNVNIFRVTGICEGNPLLTGGLRSQKSVTRSFDAFFDVPLNKRLNKIVEMLVIWDAIVMIANCLWCFLWRQPEETAEQTVDTQVNWNILTLI